MASNADLRTVRELQADAVLLVEDGNHGEYRPRRDEFSDTGVAFIRAADIRDANVDFIGADKINDVAVARIRKGIGAPGDLILTHKGTVGRVARVPHDAPPFVCSPQTTFWRVLDPSALDPDYLFAFLRSPLLSRQLRERQHDTDMAPYVSLTAQRELKVPVPEIADQRAVGSVTRALDDKIDSNRRVSRLLEQTAATEFRGRFVDAIAPALDSADTSSDWDISTLGDLAELAKEQVKPADAPDEQFEHFSIPAFDVGNGPALESGGGMLSAKSRVPGRECVLLSKLNPRTKRVWWPWPSDSAVAVCSTEFLVLVPRPGIPTSYLYGVASSDDRFYDELLSHVSGTTGSRQRVKPGDALGCRATVPDPESLSAWDAFARPLYDHAHKLGAESRRLAATRDELLPRLVSGDIRVPDSGDPAETIEPLVEEHAG